MLTSEIKTLRSECKAVDQNFVLGDESYKAHFQAAKQALARITQVMRDLEAEHRRAVMFERDSPHPDGLPQEFEPST